MTDKIELKNGTISLDELRHIIDHLPFELTWQDINDRIAFYHHGENPIFLRNPAILGTDVRDCHSEKSHPAIDEMIEKFKTGKADYGESWMTKDGRFVYIRYIAVRDKSGQYMGILEVVIDLTHLHKLKGEQHKVVYNRR